MDQTAYFEQMRQKRRSEILETARRMILDQGLFSFSMQGLAQTLDVSTVTLYKYYKNSIAIIEDLYQTTTGTLFQFPDLFPTQKKPADLALEYISLILDDMICRREDFRLVMTLGLYIYPADPVTEILPAEPFLQYLQETLPPEVCALSRDNSDFLSFATDACLSFMQSVATQSKPDLRQMKRQLLLSLSLWF